MGSLYKEVQRFYDMGLRVPDDVIMLLSDDKSGDVRRLPNAEETKTFRRLGDVLSVDYVGAPRNSKWLECNSCTKYVGTIAVDLRLWG